MTTPRGGNDVIIAPATPPGISALAMVRLSGADCIALVQNVFVGKILTEQPTHTLHLGLIKDRDEVIDEVMVGIFRAPHSFTCEESVEISCHGSSLIVERLIQLMLRNGARLATPGEFTKRAFLNGRFDLAQAEAVADLISSETDNARLAALNQMRGGFSKEIKKLRDELVHFASLIELELDFGEEDVQFAGREDLKQLINKLQSTLRPLVDSFRQGNVIKNGIPTVIAGKPNAGKSTLLNALLKEERAIVSEIPGTTRDVIEDEMILGGVNFRFMDTAGLRETSDTVEAIGVSRSKEQMSKAALIIYVVDLASADENSILAELNELKGYHAEIIRVGNKIDLADARLAEKLKGLDFVFISAAQGTHLDKLQQKILSVFHVDRVKQGDVVVTNLRHYESLRQTMDALDRVLAGLERKVTGDFLAMDVRQALYHLGLITGEITTEDLLDNIFSKFCIGK